MDYKTADLIRDYIIFKYHKFIIDTVGGVTFRDATDIEIEKTKQSLSRDLLCH